MNEQPFDFNTPITGELWLEARYRCGTYWDPTSPTLDGLQLALETDQDIPIGLEIPDTYNGKSNPLIVAHRLTSSNNSVYGGQTGIILLRKYLDPEAAVFSSSNSNTYINSTLDSYLQNEYAELCSADLKQLASDLSVYTIAGNASRKYFIPSFGEFGFGTGQREPIWDFIKQMGVTSANGGAVKGRVFTNTDGTALNYWTRSPSSSFVAIGGTNGSGNSYLAANKTAGALVACFIPKPS